MRCWVCGVAVAVVSVACAASLAQNNKPAVTPVQFPKAHHEYRVPLLSEGLKLSDFAGMKPRPGAER